MAYTTMPIFTLLWYVHRDLTIATAARLVSPAQAQTNPNVTPVWAPTVILVLGVPAIADSTKIILFMVSVLLTTASRAQFAVRLAQTQQIVSHVMDITESLHSNAPVQVMAITMISTWQIQAPTRVSPAQ
jgi:hypothetical protein